MPFEARIRVFAEETLDVSRDLLEVIGPCFSCIPCVSDSGRQSNGTGF